MLKTFADSVCSSAMTRFPYCNYSAKKQKVAKKRLDRVFLKNFKIQLDMTLLSYSDNNEFDRAI